MPCGLTAVFIICTLRLHQKNVSQLLCLGTIALFLIPFDYPLVLVQVICGHRLSDVCYALNKKKKISQVALAEFLSLALHFRAVNLMQQISYFSAFPVVIPIRRHLP